MAQAALRGKEVKGKQKYVNKCRNVGVGANSVSSRAESIEMPSFRISPRLLVQSLSTVPAACRAADVI